MLRVQRHWHNKNIAPPLHLSRANAIFAVLKIGRHPIKIFVFALIGVLWRHPIGAFSFTKKMDLLKYSKEVMQKAITDYKPKAIVMMLSGGDDSTTAYAVAKALKVPIDIVIHGYTRTGIIETTEFAIRQAEKNADKIIIADAGDAYERYVMRKGFFGIGENAHNYAYHVLKIQHFRRVVSANIRKGRRDYPILFLNGGRRQESKRRLVTMQNPYKVDPSQKNNIWVNLINEYTKHQCLDFIEGNGIERSPVAKNICRSGECMCGTMQSQGDRNEAAFFYPKWGRWLDSLEKEVQKKFPWKWGEGINKYHLAEANGQINMFKPMCQDCKISSEIK